MKEIHQVYITRNKNDTDTLLEMLRLKMPTGNTLLYEKDLFDKSTVEDLKNQFITKYPDDYLEICILRFKKIVHTTWNSLLKFFEEPPKGVTFILEINEFQQIPETIRSRATFYIKQKSDDSKAYVDLFLKCKTYSERLATISKNEIFKSIHPLILAEELLIKSKNLEPEHITSLKNIIILIEQKEQLYPILQFQYSEWNNYTALKIPFNS